MRVYVDTNVYLDYLLERRNRVGADLSDVAFGVFAKAASCRFHIVVSDHVLNEIYDVIEPGEIEMLWTMLGKKAVLLRTDAHDLLAARSVPTHFADALHVVLARKGGAEVLITRNVVDFRDLIETKRPEDI